MSVMVLLHIYNNNNIKCYSTPSPVPVTRDEASLNNCRDTPSMPHSPSTTRASERLPPTIREQRTSMLEVENVS